jgi:small neutral amino acid transporter SnatA (MarC family)
LLDAAANAANPAAAAVELKLRAERQLRALRRNSVFACVCVYLLFSFFSQKFSQFINISLFFFRVGA